MQAESWLTKRPESMRPGSIRRAAAFTSLVGGAHGRHSTPLMQRALFQPTARQINWLMLVTLLAVGEALYLRYLAIEYAPVSLTCQAGLDTWLCTTFRLTIVLFNHSVFGWVALGAALLNLLRPSIPLVALALAATAFGLVLHNANLAGVAAALILLSLARPAPAAE